MRVLFDQCWQLGITDVVVVKNRENMCFIYSYFPFSKNKCFNTFPVLMSSWEKRLSGNINITQMFFPDKLSDLYSCPLQIEYGKETRDAGYVIRWAGLVPFLLKAMKATPRIIDQIDGDYPNVIHKRTDILFDIFYQNVERLQKFVFSPVSSTTTSGICFPDEKRPVVEWSRILNEFSRSVWCGVLICATVVVSYVYFVFYKRTKNIGSVVLETLRELLNAPVPMFPVTRWQDRVCLPLWWYFCFLLNSAYLSSLKSKVTVPYIDHPINSIEEFQKLDIPIHVTKATYKFTTETLLSDHKYKPITDKLVVFRNLSHNDVFKSHKGSAAYICEDDDVDVYLNGSYQLLPDMLFETLLSICVLPRPSPYERLFKRSFLRIFDAGAIDHVKETSIHAEILRRQIIDNNVPLSLRALSGVFVVWISGSCAAFIAFLAEIVVVRSSMKHYIESALFRAEHFKVLREARNTHGQTEY